MVPLVQTLEIGVQLFGLARQLYPQVTALIPVSGHWFYAVSEGDLAVAGVRFGTS